ncbi:MAG: hypothetical protein SVM80_04445 [Halobacteriota archaeon]|nr:hypothetical protein [Halobacteriota archaeon]
MKMNSEISEEEKMIVEALAEEEMGIGTLRGKLSSSGIDLRDEKMGSVLEEIIDHGLVFAKQDMYSITLLGAFVYSGLMDEYESIRKRKDLFDFFRTRIPATIPKELISKFRFSDDFQIIGQPDFVDRMGDLLNEAMRIAPIAKEEILVAVDRFFRPGFLYLIGVVRNRQKLRGIFSETEYNKDSTFAKIAKKFINMELRVVGMKGQSIGMYCVDDKYCMFGFRTIKDVPGSDALIYSADIDCIKWVKENFEYVWKNLASEG